MALLAPQPFSLDTADTMMRCCSGTFRQMSISTESYSTESLRRTDTETMATCVTQLKHPNPSFLASWAAPQQHLAPAPAQASTPLQQSRLEPWRTEAELCEALSLLDMNGDGKIWGSDLDSLVELAFNVYCSSDLNLQVGGCSSWQSFKSSCECCDGLLDLTSLLYAARIGILQSEAARLPRVRAQGNTTSHWLPTVGGSGGECYVKPLGRFCSVREYVEAFNQVDCDKNGVICKRDLKEFLKSFSGMDVTTSGCKEIIKAMDKNQNGVIDLAEFGALIGFLSEE